MIAFFIAQKRGPKPAFFIPDGMRPR